MTPQTLILRQSQPWLAYVPVESEIRERQEAYYAALSSSDRQAEATDFIVFMLQAFRDTLNSLAETDQAADQVTDQVKSLLHVLAAGELTLAEAMKKLSLSHRPSFRARFVSPALKLGLIERTQPDSPRSPTQRYLLTEKGRSMLRELVN